MSSKEQLPASIDDADDPDAGPDWMQPPPEARYRAFSNDTEKTAVILEPSIRDYLDSVFANAPQRGGPSAYVEVWFDASSSSEDPSQVDELIAEVGPKTEGEVCGFSR